MLQKPEIEIQANSGLFARDYRAGFHTRLLWILWAFSAAISEGFSGDSQADSLRIFPAHRCEFIR
jgi:hypothetical protein